jgi:kynurenine 3-monooxygenase
VILPARGEWNWDGISAPQQVDKLFAAKFPDAFSATLRAKDSVKLTQQRASPGGTTTSVSSMIYRDNVVLIGDAAHSCWPSLGQGANVALESTHALRVTFEELGEDLPKALGMFNKLRKPQVDACGRLSMAGFGGTTKRTISGLFFARLVFISLLNKVLPTVFLRPAIFEVSNSMYSYDEVENMMRRENVIFLSAIMASLASFILFAWKKFPSISRAVGAVLASVGAKMLGAA